jgi:hypothetical protein
MKLKLDEAGHVVVVDGKPVYIHDDGKEIPFDAPATVATITRLNSEAKGHREAKEEAQNKLKAFEGITDPAAALKAIETVANLDLKKLVDAGKIDEVKAEAKRAFDDQVKAIQEAHKPVIAERDTLKGQLHAEKLGNAFSRSKYIADNLAVPIDMVQATFGNGFKVEENAIVGYQNGNKIFSRVKPGDVAGFDEALEIMVDAYAFKDHILKGSGASGGGAGGGGGKGGSGTITRAQLSDWQAKDPARAAAEMAKVREGRATLVD